MVEIKETTPTWTFKKQLENQVGKLEKEKFHYIWHEYFAPNYKRLTIEQLDKESNCTLCGHKIFKQVGILELTGSKVVKYNGIDFSIPNRIEVGCDCYSNGIKPILNICEKLQSFFPKLKLKIVDDKIDINELIFSLTKYNEKYKIFLPIKYLHCRNFEHLALAMSYTLYTRYYPTNRAKKNISDVVYDICSKPLSKVRPGQLTNTWQCWANIFDNPNYIVVINSDMINNLKSEKK